MSQTDTPEQPSLLSGRRYRTDNGQRYTVLAVERDTDDIERCFLQFDDGTFFDCTREAVEADDYLGTADIDVGDACEEGAHIFHYGLLTDASTCAKCGLSIDTLGQMLGQGVSEKAVYPQHLRDEVREDKRQHAID